MCGIAGQVRTDGRPAERALLGRMCEMQEHRGPDSSGLHLDGPVGLGIQRLRVIDLDTGDQPLYNEDGSIAVVLNGEIYNYRELRADLGRRGHRFSSKGDTEVIAHLYEELGPMGCVRELDGMFAFAVWDAREHRLLLARDRVGKKPLLYCHRPGALTFASEMRALLQDQDVPRELDYVALDSYLAYEYVPAPLSAFRAVRKLPPGCMLTYEQGRVSIERHWRLRYDREPASRDPREIEEELRERIRAAVRRRLISDVPLGAFLSGGIDSSVVVAAMAEASPEPVKTFSIGFAEESFNELPNARLVADRFATDHHEMVVRPDALSIIPRIVRHYGEPFADSSTVPNFVISELTSRKVTVALNGDGGDEAFAGYDRYVTGVRMNRMSALMPPFLRRAIGAISGNGADPFGGRRRVNQARRLAHALSLSPGDRYGLAMSTFPGHERQRLYSPEFLDLIGDAAGPRVIEGAWDRATGRSIVDVMLEVDVNTYLPDDLLVKMDIASMAHSLEARSPFLDRDLMEFAASLPGSMKLSGAEKKVVLRQALRGWIPDQIIDGPKRGFGLPMAGRWFRGELRDHIVEVLTDSRALSRGYFRQPALRGLLDRHLSGQAENASKLWTLMMFEIWHREFVDVPSSALSGLHA
jgi:asparagine synthase (glutamine-hydrolysing)